MNIFKNKLLISWLGLAVIGFACQPSQDTLSTPTGAIKNSGVSAADVQPTEGITPDPTIPSTTPSFNILAQTLNWEGVGLMNDQTFLA